MPTTTMPTPRYVETNGIRMGVYEAGAGFPIVLLHGWPELAYSWRHQIAPLTEAGYRVIAPDQRGYGLTDCPEAVEEYDMAHLTGDLVGLLDALEIERAVFAGHDWGGLVGWQMPLLHPERVAGVIGVNTPFLPRLPLEPIGMMRLAFGERMYIVWFQDSDGADRALERDPRRVFRTIMRSPSITNEQFVALPPEARRFDFIQQFDEPEPDALGGDPLLDEDELSFFADAFAHTGFTAGINWYRNLTRNWRACEGVEQRVTVPALMVSGEDDVVLPPAMANGMEGYVPDLEKHVLPGCGHWTQQERPAELSGLMTDWLQRRFPAS